MRDVHGTRIVIDLWIGVGIEWLVTGVKRGEGGDGSHVKNSYTTICGREQICSLGRDNFDSTRPQKPQDPNRWAERRLRRSSSSGQSRY